MGIRAAVVDRPAVGPAPGLRRGLSVAV